MNIVRELRKKRGIQQKELAITIGVSQPTVSEWEANKTDPSGERLKKLAEYFGVDELVILGKGNIIKDQPAYSPVDPKIAGVSETEQIVQHVLQKLGATSKTPEINIVSGLMEKMSKAQQEQVVAVVRAMAANYHESLDK